MKGRHRASRGSPDMYDRKYGFFRCSCGKKWESAQVYCHKGTKKVAYAQDCKKCKTAVNPFRLEDITCSRCSSTQCTCTAEEKRDRHTDPNKPHPSELCHKCRAGKPCGQRSY